MNDDKRHVSPEPLRRWFVRRSIIFVVCLVAVFGAMLTIGWMLERAGALDFLSQD